MAPPALVMATKNPGKVRELAALLSELGFTLLSLADFPEIPEIPEEGATFAENARTKAQAVARLTWLPALADDSGLEVEALKGRPRVFSARYAQDRTAGQPPMDEDNWQKLLDELRGVPQEQRGARFVCEIALALPDGRLITTRGELAGFIKLFQGLQYSIRSLSLRQDLNKVREKYPHEDGPFDDTDSCRWID